MSSGMTPDEITEFGDLFAEIDQAVAHLELAAHKLAQRGYRDRAHKTLGAAQVAAAQKDLLVQDWRELVKRRVETRTGAGHMPLRGRATHANSLRSDTPPQGPSRACCNKNRVAGRALKGGLNFEGRGQQPLIASRTPAPFESIEQQRFFSWLEQTARLYPEGSHRRETLSWIHSIPNGAFMGKRHAMKMVAEGLTKGILDISCDEPSGGYHGLRIEMKRRGGRVSPEQRAYMLYLDRINVRRAVCYSWQEAARIVLEYLGLPACAPIFG